MKRLIATSLALLAVFPASTFAHAGFSDSDLTRAENWLLLTVVYAPIACIAAAGSGLVASILFGTQNDHRIRPSGRAGLLAVFIVAGLYAVGMAVLAFVKD